MIEPLDWISPTVHVVAWMTSDTYMSQQWSLLFIFQMWTNDIQVFDPKPQRDDLDDFGCISLRFPKTSELDRKMKHNESLHF